MAELLSELRVLLLAAIQGVSEIFPISSSGHLVVFSNVFQTPISFDLVVFFHVGTFFAILVKYHVQVWKVISGKFGWKLLLYLFLSILATGLVGLSIRQIADHLVAERANTVTVLWMVNGIIIIIIGLLSPQGKRNFRELRLWEFILIGLIQGLTAIPGISRLGMTLGAGLLLGLVWVEALDLSFILSLPTIFFANIYTFLHEPDGFLSFFAALSGNSISGLLNSGFGHHDTSILISGLFLSFISGMIAIKILYNHLSKKLMMFFGLYCLFAGLFFFFFLKLF